MARLVIVLRLVAAAALPGGCFTDGGGADGGSTEPATSGPGDPTESASDPATCDAGCAPAVCGDGVAMAPEQCDDGNADNSDACTDQCTLATCGDGHVQGGEGCDDGPANADDGACTASCALPVCGDGLLQAGVEACDDGNLDDGDGCSSVCTTPMCGNGLVDLGEECDDGDADDADACLTGCVAARCGDGVVNTQDGAEECDDGNAVDTDACLSACTLARCGDGVLHAGEACDDGNADDLDTCDAKCGRLAYYIFVTSERYTGALGGLAGADDRCNELASAAGLAGAGNYRAWLSDDTAAATQRLLHSEIPYILPDASMVANHYNELAGGGLDHTIDRDEHGLPVAGADLDCPSPLGIAWTATQEGGLPLAQHCEAWTSALVRDRGTVGLLLETSTQWTAACTIDCSARARLYCVEQPAQG